MKDILLLDKPAGITSYDCIRILKRRYPCGTKIGHAGTLDPMATGLMLIGVGAGTKKLHDYLKLDKTYEAEILLGVSTDTGDITGKAIEEYGIENIELGERLRKTVEEMSGRLELPVPLYSAIKRGGEALYKKARRGEKVEPPIKTMEVRAVEFLGVTDLAEFDGRRILLRVRFDVSSGTYIRSLAEELGRRLGVPATLAGLRRTRIGEFKVEEAQSL